MSYYICCSASTCLPVIYNSVHDPDYRTSWKDWESFVESLTERISEIDETIPELPPKDLVSACPMRTKAYVDALQVFRIYRDVRFSNDPTPYKVGLLYPIESCFRLTTFTSLTSQLHGISTLVAMLKHGGTDKRQVSHRSKRTLCVLLCSNTAWGQKSRRYAINTPL